jgi:hypothetical protein
MFYCSVKDGWDLLMSWLGQGVGMGWAGWVGIYTLYLVLGIHDLEECWGMFRFRDGLGGWFFGWNVHTGVYPRG